MLPAAKKLAGHLLVLRTAGVFGAVISTLHASEESIAREVCCVPLRPA
jgi:hypothetical protein